MIDIQLVIVSTGDRFDLPSDIKISIEQNNTMVTNQGSYSLPLTLAPTPNNLRILGYPTITTISTPKDDMEVILIAGSIQKKGVLHVISAGLAEGISISILLDESNFYSKIKDKTLEDSFSDLVFDYFSQNENKVGKWIEYLTNIYNGGGQSEPFSIFSVICQMDGNTIERELNGYEFVNKETVKLYNSEPRVVKVDQADVELPVGYNVTPFWKLSHMLRSLFSIYGFELEANLFDTDPDLSKIVLINNTCDTILPGKVYARHLVPSCGVSDFMEALSNKMGCEFIFNESTRSARIVFWRDVLRSAHYKDLSSLIIGDIRYTVVAPKALKLSCEHLIYGREVNYTTIQELRRDYTNIVYDRAKNAKTPGAYFLTDRLIYVFRKMNAVNFDYISYDTLDYIDDKWPLDYEEKASTIKDVNIWTRPQLNGFKTYSPYIGESSNRTSYIIISGEKEKDQKTEIPFILMYARSLPIYTFGFQYDAKVLSGSTHRYNDFSGGDGRLDLVYGGEYGLYNRMWRDYDLSIRKKNFELTSQIDLSPESIINYSFDQLVVIGSSRYITSHLKYEISRNGIKVIEAQFKTI